MTDRAQSRVCRRLILAGHFSNSSETQTAAWTSESRRQVVPLSEGQSDPVFATLIEKPTVVLLFKKKFLAAIARGEKTQTVRLWKYRKMRPGQRSYIPGIGYISVLAVDEVALAALTDDDAQLDGFETGDALRSEIQSLYGEALAAGSLAFRIRFRVLDPREQAAAVAERESRRSTTDS